MDKAAECPEQAFVLRQALVPVGVGKNCDLRSLSLLVVQPFARAHIGKLVGVIRVSFLLSGSSSADKAAHAELARS